jgi:hypothetical protein
MNCTVKGVVPESTVERNDATGTEGASLTVIYPARVTVVLPPAFVAVSVTV